MALKNSYVVWNNKGGVGKSTIVFNLAARYAELHPTEQVLVVDMCPQANVTMMLLGGNQQGESELLTLQANAHPNTIVGFISDQIGQTSGTKPAPKQYHFAVAQKNHSMPPTSTWSRGTGISNSSRRLSTTTPTRSSLLTPGSGSISGSVIS